MLIGLLLALQIIVSLFLIVVVLLQRSEGGALGMGGGPSGFMTARGAGDFLTRTTWTLGAAFFIISLALTILAGRENGAASVVDRVKVDSIDLNQPASQPQPAPAQTPQGPAPLQAPTPTIRNPFLGQSQDQSQPPAQQ
jgi:preprotein translocase subunit SecG